MNVEQNHNQIQAPDSQRLNKLIEEVRGTYEDNGDPGHDFAHICRVIDSCRRIGRTVGANLETLLPAAVLHDVVNVPKNHPDRILASEQAAGEASRILMRAGYSAAEIEKIQIVILEHSYSLGKKPSSVESAVMQDADRLDAIGAIGLMRTVSCGCRMGAKYYSLEEPFAHTRALDDKKFTIDHLYVKLFKLGDQFNTEEARREGLKRITFMKEFVSQLQSEICAGSPT